ncbi:uncharacterized protein LOC130636316 isoform X2 [Hydractinia symbiolongicarpus]|nr:uncharacterized protein LOC130636316 isoform X2 [Hydractinia symbiolongicarpus]
MAPNGKNTCQLCGKAIKEPKHRIYFYGEKGICQRFTCHVDCFNCNVCKRTLSMQNYFLSPRKLFYCWEHADFELPNHHENLIRELRKFREISRENLSCLQSGKTPSSLKNKLRLTLSKCRCCSEPLLLKSRGFWNECTEESCPLLNCYSQLNDTRNYNVPLWEEENQNEVFFKIEHYEEEIYETCFLEEQHFNYYSVDELVGPLVMSLKQEIINNKFYYRVLIRSSSHVVEGLIPVSCFCSKKYNERQVLEVLCKELQISSSLRPFNEPTPNKLYYLDKVMLKEEFKVGVVFINDGQIKEEDFFTNTGHNSEFEDFLCLLGDKVKLKDFKGYNGGLDTSHGLTGEHSIYKEWQKYKIMFHVSTLLPMEEHDDQKLQRKRHIGNDIVCIVFLAPGAQFDPNSIKSNFLHVFIIIQPQWIESGLYYKVAVVSRDLVLPFGPAIFPSKLFKKGEIFQNWLFTKIINGERASYRSPKFSAMQERTRRQLLEEIVHDQACKEVPTPRITRSAFQRFLPQRSSARSSPPNFNIKSRTLGQYPPLFSESFENGSQPQKNFNRTFSNGVSQYHDVFFNVGTYNQQIVPGVKAILSARSRVFNEMLFPTECNLSQLRRRSSMLSRTPPAHLTFMRSQTKWSELWKKARSTSHESPSPKSSIVDLRNQNSSEYVITEFEVSEFTALCDFLHTGVCVVHVDIVSGLACAAEYYDVPDLLNICVECCADLLNPHNACIILSSLRKHVLKYNVAGLLQNMVLKYISESAEQVFASFDMSSLSEDCFFKVLAQDLKISEKKKFKTLKKWYARISSLANFVHDELKPSLLSHINMARLSKEEQQEVAKFRTHSITIDTSSSAV